MSRKAFFASQDMYALSEQITMNNHLLTHVIGYIQYLKQT